MDSFLNNASVIMMTITLMINITRIKLISMQKQRNLLKTKSLHKKRERKMPEEKLKQKLLELQLRKRPLFRD